MILLGHKQAYYRMAFPDFVPHSLWRGADLQTMRNVMVGAPPELDEHYASRHIFPMPDDTGDKLYAMLHGHDRLGQQPLILLLHGMTGSEDSHYMRQTTQEMLQLGFPVMRLNLRGAGPGLGRCQQQYHGGRTQDLRFTLAQWPDLWLSAGLVLIGFSLGGNIALKFAGEEAAHATLGCPDESCGLWLEHLKAVISVSAPIDLGATERRMSMARNRLYHRYMLNRFRTALLQIPIGFSDEERNAILSAQSVFMLDDIYTSRYNGWQDAPEYYAVNSAKRFLPAITCPTLMLHAQNDPWIPVETYLDGGWMQNRHLFAVLPEEGGHLGFHDSHGTWHDRAAAHFLDQVLG